MDGVKNKWEIKIYYYITTLPLLYFFGNNQNPEKWSVFFLRISSVNENGSVVTSRYPQVYNFSFTK